MAKNSASDLKKLLEGWTIRTSSEKALQDDLEKILQIEALDYSREVPVTGGIIDFVVGRVGVECKIKCSLTSVLRQVSLYSQSDEFEELLLVTAASSHRSASGNTLQGKPLIVHWVNSLH